MTLFLTRQSYRLVWLLAITSFLIFTVSACRSTHQVEGAPLGGIRSEHLPPESEVLDEGDVELGDFSHPLAQRDEDGASLPLSEVVYEYTSVTTYQAVTPQAVAVLSYVYQYENPDAAQAALNNLYDALLAGPTKPSEIDDHGSQEAFPGEESHVMAIQNSEGGHTSWFIGAQGDRLYLTVTDGFEQSTVEATLDAVLERWLQG